MDDLLGECLERIKAAGYAGAAVWSGGTQGWMGCLMSHDDTKPLYDTNLWNYAATPIDVFAALADYAEKYPHLTTA